MSELWGDCRTREQWSQPHLKAVKEMCGWGGCAKELHLSKCKASRCNSGASFPAYHPSLIKERL